MRNPEYDQRMVFIEEKKDGGVILHLHVQPRAAKSRIAGVHDGCLKLAIASPPVDGKANKEVVRFLATILGVAPGRLAVRYGMKSRRKQVVVNGLSPAEIRQRIDGVMGQ